MQTLIAELRSTLAKMEAAMGAIQEAIFWTDSSGRLQWCNSGFEVITGLPRYRLLGHHLSGILPLCSGGQVITEDRHPVMLTLRDKELHYGIYEYRCEPDACMLELQCFPLREGSVEGCVVGTVSNLSHPRVSSFSQIQGVALAISANAVGVLTASGRISWVNAAWEAAAGRKLRELHGEILALGECAEGTCLETILEKTAAGESWSGEIDSRLFGAAGRVEVLTATPVKDASGRLASIVVMKHDITALRESEEALMHSEGKLRAILEEAVDAIITADETGVIEAANSAACEMFGYKQEALLGSNVSILAPPEIRPHHGDYMRRYLDGGTPRIIGIGREAEAVRKDGVRIPIELSISEIKVGAKRYFTAIIRDISERKFWEQQLMELNENLRVKQRSINEALVSAAEIQRSLLPSASESHHGLDIAWKFIPSEQLGGDMLGMVELDKENGIVGMYMVDVAGHGVPAALVGVSVVQALQYEFGVVYNQGPVMPGKVLETLDRLFPLHRFGRHFTIFYAVLNIRTGEMVYSNGGHPLAYVVRHDGSLEQLEQGGTLIGLGGLLPFDEGKVRLEAGDMVLMYTDGIIELENKFGEQFGEERVRALLQMHAGQPTNYVLDELYGMAYTYSDTPAQDDISLFGIGIPGKQKENTDET